MSTNSTNTYEPDEFDLSAEDMPQGMHRAPRPRWKSLLPFLVALIVGPLLAWGAIYFVTHKSGQNEPPSATEQTQSQSATAPEQEATPTQPEEKPTQEEKSTPDSQPQEEAQPVVDKDLSVMVYNNLNNPARSGTATSSAQKLISEGFSNASYGNGDYPQAETFVAYGEEADKATAQQVASILGVETVRSEPSILKDHRIVVMLSKGYR